MYFCLYISWLSDLPNRLMSYERSPDERPGIPDQAAYIVGWYRFVVGLFLNAQVFFMTLSPCLCLCNGLCAPI